MGFFFCRVPLAEDDQRLIRELAAGDRFKKYSLVKQIDKPEGISD